jgi:hypoxanthine phosphoribosyltransferase
LNEVKLKKNETIFLIDDYIGSGETLNFCLDELRVNPTINNDKINIISLASQNEIYEKLKAEGIAFYTDFISKKGISDDYSPPFNGS